MNISELKEAIEAGKIFGTPQYKPPKKEEKKSVNPQSDFLAAMREAGEKYSSTHKHGEKDYEKELAKEDKIRLCTHQSGIYGYRKLVNGLVQAVPRYCNYCEKCHSANAGKLKDKIDFIAQRTKEVMPNGKWRKKTVDEGTEAQSLKKHIKRKQDGRHLELACEPGKSEVWTYTMDEPGKDMDEVYGEPAELEDIDFDDLYAKNRSSGKKVSTGAAFRNSGSPLEKEDTERVLINEVLVKDASRQAEAEKIMHETNYVEIAEDADHAKRLYIYQFKFILKELKKAGIEIAAIKATFYNMSRDDLLRDWNNNVNYWMSIFAPLPSLNSEAKMDIDTSRLVFPTTSKSNLQ